MFRLIMTLERDGGMICDHDKIAEILTAKYGEVSSSANYLEGFLAVAVRLAQTGK